jgi:hypothetical protein
MSKKKFYYKRFYQDGIWHYEIDLLKMDGSPVKMSDFLERLPNGIFDKAVTGLGGTTIELDCDRPSIIVEPLNITAVTKAMQLSRTRKHKIHYFGTKNIKPELNETMRSSLKKYLTNCNRNDQHPKIICIADQLSNLRGLIVEFKMNFNDFHLLLDEIDYMQEQTNYRKSMDDAIGIYLEHRKKNRTLLSATISSFTDPRLKKERTSKVIIREFPKILSELYTVENFPTAILEVIRRKSDSEYKFLIALNNIKYIKETILALVEAGFVSEDLAVLCSEANQDHFEGYFRTLDEAKLPAKYNFITAAYFNGYDLDESVNLILCVDYLSPTLRLSGRTLYQIQGRARLGVNTCAILGRFGTNGEALLNKSMVDEMIKIYQPLNESYKLMNSSNIPLVKRNAEKFRNILVNGVSELQSIWKYEKDELSFSFFKIDKIIEDNRVKSILRSANNFQLEVKKYFLITSVQELNTERQTLADDPRQALIDFVNDLATSDWQNPIFEQAVYNLLNDERDYNRKQILLLVVRTIKNQNLFKYTSVINALLNILNEDAWKGGLDNLQLHMEYHAVVSGPKKFLGNVFPMIFKSNAKYSAGDLKGRIQVFIRIMQSFTETDSSIVHSVFRKFKNPRVFEKAMLVTIEKRPKGKIQRRVVSFDVFNILNLEKYSFLDFSVEYEFQASIIRRDLTDQELFDLVRDQLISSTRVGS